MKRIAIFCDGTWNSPTMAEPTSVVRLHTNSLESDDQHLIYLPGVGVGKLRNQLTTWANKIGGGAFGWGLARNVKKAYAELCRVYEEGDQIYIFGFSRGAYTARSLAGMIRKCGIVPKDDLGVITLQRAWNLYKKSGDKHRPDSDHIWKKRLSLSPDVATSTIDLEKRGNQGHIVNIAYLGVWDTVGALGIREGLVGPLAKLWNWRYRFHDTELSSLVQSARHAVALDEQRVFYEPSLWNNLTGPDGLNDGRTGNDRPYQQLWFIGSHSIVGGSSGSRALVSYPLDWIAKGAAELGLTYNPDARIPDHAGDALFETNELTDPGLVYKIAPHLRKSRSHILDVTDCHDSVGLRIRHFAGLYRPGPVMPFMTALLSEEPPVLVADADPTPATLPA